jgi:hypothetical protein
MMRLQTLLNKVKGLQARIDAKTDEEMLQPLRLDPTQVLLRADVTPDPWQEQLLRSQAARMLLLASRQAGKSSVAAALALHTALVRPNAPVLLLSPSTRQSGELFRKVTDLFVALGRPARVVAESALRIEFGNGSRVVSLPGTEGTIRGFSGVALLVIDEAARVADALYCAVRPMLAVSQGRLIALSTPFGKRGWFHEEWNGQGDWERVRVTAPECQRIPASFLAEERRALGERWYRQEYECSFEDMVGAVFSHEDIQAALSDDIKPLFME